MSELRDLLRPTGKGKSEDQRGRAQDHYSPHSFSFLSIHAIATINSARFRKKDTTASTKLGLLSVLACALRIRLEERTRADLCGSKTLGTFDDAVVVIRCVG